ncbi:helix-turn-helix domain-containing protein [Ferroplasma sp.]|uniref:helix-turn-helix domain-containing protein n=1 Tax=Ferroplasma sp. TaxID=2591003 RepID=UPI00307CEDE3
MKNNLREISLVADHPKCMILNKLMEINVQARIFELNAGIDTTNHLIGINDYKNNIPKLKDDSITIYKNIKDKTWMESSSCEVCTAAAKLNALIINVKVFHDGKVQYKMLFQKQEILKLLKEQLDSTDIKYSISDIDQKIPNELTLRQKEILYIAFRMGYFDITRKIKLEDIANEVGISKKSVQITLRRALNKIVLEYVFENL